MVGLIILAIVVALGIASIFVVRRHGESDRPQPGWNATDEVFNDPSTNRLMRVWVDGAGNRHYVPEGRRATGI
jgi:hypothetical protein